MSHSSKFLKEAINIASQLSTEVLEKMANEIFELRKRKGRIFFLGIGGSAANASHAVNDFRKICGIECYSPSDNVSELTARANDDGWETIYSEWLKVSNLSEKDALFVLSVGGGNEKRNVSTNLISALKLGVERQACVFGIIGRDGGYVKNVADHILIIPNVNAEHVTPHAEAFQAVCWHCLVSHPKLKINETKW
ncbi:MAG: SIS domain-containing protein [Paracoccaceae bacterium]|nr:SIS domain-containing protein [Paracoccaceae bacterium]